MEVRTKLDRLLKFKMDRPFVYPLWAYSWPNIA